MYSLSIDPYQICSIRYEDIIDKDLICFWDNKTSFIKLLFMYHEPRSDITFIRNIARLQKGETRATKKTMLDNMKISGHFIIDASPTSIYNKFITI